MISVPPATVAQEACWVLQVPHVSKEWQRALKEIPRKATHLRALLVSHSSCIPTDPLSEGKGLGSHVSGPLGTEGPSPRQQRESYH